MVWGLVGLERVRIEDFRLKLGVVRGGRRLFFSCWMGLRVDGLLDEGCLVSFIGFCLDEFGKTRRRTSDLL